MTATLTDTEVDVDLSITPPCEATDENTGLPCPHPACWRLTWKPGCKHVPRSMLVCDPCYQGELLHGDQWKPGAWTCFVCGAPSTLMSATKI